jgi:acetyltransferase-like isoleucine patch superfamily enzyme
MNGYEEYAFDCFLRSYENKETLIELTSNYQDNEKLDLLNNVYKDLKIWHKAYDYVENYLFNNVKLSLEGELHLLDKVDFHPKYGWVVSYNGNKAFLGKASIYEKLKVIIGHRSYISGNCNLRGNGLLEIGAYSSIGWNLYVFVEYENHPYKYPGNINFSVESRLVDDGMSLSIPNPMEEESNKVIIGNDVFIGRNVNIMNGVTIHDGCVIGANSMVTKDCEPFGIYVGTPAKLISKRFPDKIISQMEALKWWRWPFEKIKRNVSFFNTNLSNYCGDINSLIIQ